jgi:hypothetical protein
MLCLTFLVKAHYPRLQKEYPNSENSNTDFMVEWDLNQSRVVNEENVGSKFLPALFTVVSLTIPIWLYIVSGMTIIVSTC